MFACDNNIQIYYYIRQDVSYQSMFTASIGSLSVYSIRSSITCSTKNTNLVTTFVTLHKGS